MMKDRDDNMANNEILVFQYYYIIRYRNGRLLLSLICFLFVVYFCLLALRPGKSVSVTYDPTKDPVSMKLKKLESQVDSLLNFFTDLLNFKNRPNNENIMSSFEPSAMDSFWHGRNKTDSSKRLYEKLFNTSRVSNHTSGLITSTRCGKKMPILVLVFSHPKDFERRKIVRKTWGSAVITKKMSWKTFFLLGRQNSELYLSNILQEQSYYGDLIFGNVEEDVNLLVKKLHMGFEWSLKYCDFDYLIKSDDRAFINMGALFKQLRHEDTPKRELYLGNVQYQTKVLRDGPDSLGRTEYSKVVFPRYCASGGYVLSKDSVEKMLPLFLTTAPLRFDDIYVGILALKSGIDPTHCNEFQMFRDERKCEYNRHGIILHPVVREDCMMDLFKESLKKTA